MGVGTPISQDSDQNFVDRKLKKKKIGEILGATMGQFTFLSRFSVRDWCLTY